MENLKTGTRTSILLAVSLICLGNQVSWGQTIDEIKAPEIKADEPNCTYAKEYITSLEYFRAHKEFELPDNVAKEIAWKISRGCNHSAQRFIRVTATLSRSGTSMRDAVHFGLEFVQRTDTEAETFLVVFTRSFLADFLDLDIKTSLDLASSLSTQFKGNSMSARKDFEKFVHFCSKTRGDLSYPIPFCARLSADLAGRGERFPNGIADPLIELYTFLRSDHGPSLASREALKLATDLMQGGPEATPNFIQAYQYAVSKKGLAVGEAEALHFAQKMAVPKRTPFVVPGQLKASS